MASEDATPEQAKSEFDAEMERIQASQFYAVAMFARYMKDCWKTPEGKSALLHGMEILGSIKRVTDHLRRVLDMKDGGATDVILAAAARIAKHEGVNHA
jgi:hypothetical protein